ncbi:PIN domain-containing protein [Streptomyces sp. ST2-7A]|uniref:PIN domain-containing protein n=1 Tax=Streptomyces sp. ST2-7A TaxID=2907214 RepID=UPI001F45F22C|nr:PIN domain-containing protein [Streptomyces sp. ST2-7A]MCE7080044.1 PIN domain-containing protein [Streptomyces sp. ST2-7A]
MSPYYMDAGAPLKPVRREAETKVLRHWREALGPDARLATSQLAGVEIARTFRRAGMDRQRVPFLVGNTLVGVDQIAIDDETLVRAAGHEVQKLGTLDAIHLATAAPLRDELTGFVTYDRELIKAVLDIGLPHLAPPEPTPDRRTRERPVAGSSRAMTARWAACSATASAA